jgi:general secretion pathway protein A
VYESFYGFAEKPFSLTPDPKYLYLSPRHAEAFAHLEYGHREHGGFILITGEVGTGKTTLARYFLSRLPPETHTAFVLYPALSARELFHTILEDLHVQANGDSRKALVDALHRFLLEARAAGRDVVLLIDEAQDLSPEVLEQIRLISNLETDTDKLIQIVLLGQSELRDLLARHELRQLAQRVTARYHIAPLSRPETEAYVRHRLRVAGGEGKVAFSDPALREVHRRSGGIPRLINLVCDRALLAGYVRGERVVRPEMVRQAATEVRGRTPAAPMGWRHGLVASLLALGLALLAFAAAPRLARAPAEGPEDVAPATLPTPSPTPTPVPPNARLEDELRTIPREASFRAALARVQEPWGDVPVARTSLRTHLDQLRRLDVPAVLEMFHPARRDTCFLALIRLDAGEAFVTVGSGPSLRAPAGQIEALWTHEAVLTWPEDPALRQNRAAIADRARQTLDRLGYDEPDLEAAVKRFQGDASLVVDGVLGSRTRMALFALSSGPRPRLSEAPAP